MLELRPNCECCDNDLAPDSSEAMICTFECTFCKECAETVFKSTCPNCGGNFSARPIRPNNLLKKYPASSVRVISLKISSTTYSDFIEEMVMGRI